MNSLQHETLKRIILELPKEDQFDLLAHTMRALDVDVAIARPPQEDPEEAKKFEIFRTIILHEAISEKDIPEGNACFLTSRLLRQFEVYKLIAEKCIGYCINVTGIDVLLLHPENCIEFKTSRFWNQTTKLPFKSCYIGRFYDKKNGIRIPFDELFYYIARGRQNKVDMILFIFGYKDGTPELMEKLKEITGVNADTIDQCISQSNKKSIYGIEYFSIPPN